jgi:hypothetical protein
MIDLNSRLRRVLLLVAVLGTLLLVAMLPTAAEAHNGVGAAFKGRAGPYTVYAYDGYPLPPKAIEYRLVLLDTKSSEPADDVTVIIKATKPGTPATNAEWHAYANVVYYTLPNAYPHDWTIDLSLAGRAGHGRVRFGMHGIQPVEPTAVQVASSADQGARTGLVVGVSIAGVMLAAALVLVWRRQRA